MTNSVCLLIFLLGQAKLAILKTHQCKNAGQDVNLLSLFKSLVGFRVAVEFAYYKQTDNVPFFQNEVGCERCFSDIE